MLGQMTGGFAHDINNILAVITGAAKLLERDAHKQFDAAQMERITPRITAITHAAARGAELSQRLLRFGQDDSLAPAQCDLTALLRDNAPLLQSVLTRRITLTINAPDQPVWVHGQTDTITHIIMNLAMNAREAITHDGTVTVSLILPSPQEVVLLFHDTGCGIDPSNTPHIFDPFFTTKTRAGGLGLGLSLAGDMMRSYDGSIHARSAIGIGTEITLTFRRMCLMAVSTHALNDTADFTERTILVVDDKEDLLPILAEQLDSMGLKVLRAANADAALRIQHNYDAPIDFLLTDVVMPGLNGVRLADQLRASRPQVGVVYMTGYARNPEIIRRMAPLPEHALVVPKPLDTRVLSDALEQALAQVQGMN